MLFQHERSLSIAASSSSDFTPGEISDLSFSHQNNTFSILDSPDDSPERKTSSGVAEWRALLASAATREQRLHQALTAVRREKSAPIGRNRRATSPADLGPSVVNVTDDALCDPKSIDKRQRVIAPVVPVASPEAFGGTPVSTPIVPECGTVGSPFQRAKGIIVRRVSSNRKGLLVKRSTSSNSQGGDDGTASNDDQMGPFDDTLGELADIDGDETFETTHKRASDFVEWRPHKPALALKRGSAPVVEKKVYRATNGEQSTNGADSQAKRKSQSISTTSAPNTDTVRSQAAAMALRQQDDLAYV